MKNYQYSKLKNKSLIQIFACLLIISILPSYYALADTDVYTAEELFNAEFESSILSRMENNDINSSSVSVIYQDEVVYAKGFGDQNDVNLSYLLASITKTFTATAMLQLYEQGLVDLDANINIYLPFIIRHPDYPTTALTIRQILTHMSSIVDGGLPSGSLVNGFPSWIYDVLNENGTYYSSDCFGSYAPDALYSYSNLGYDLLAYLVELIAGQPYNDYLRDNIWEPLNMTHSFFNVSNYPAEQIVTHYYLNETSEEYVPFVPYTFLGGQGSYALYSSATDLATYLTAHMNNGTVNGHSLLNETTTQLMHEEHVPGYCFGWFPSRVELINDFKIQGHGGGSPVCDTNMFYSVQHKVGVVYLINNGESVTTSIYNYIFKTAIKIDQPKTTAAKGYSLVLAVLAIGLLVPLIRRRKK